MNKKKIGIPLYCGTVIIIQTDNFRKLEKKYKFESVSEMAGFMFRNPTKKGVARYGIVFRNKTDSAIIAHECLHLVNCIFEDSSIVPDLKNDEPQCYLLGWIVSECHKFLKVNDSKL